VSLIGGKWTTYRKMAEDVVEKAARGILPPASVSVTPTLRIHGYTEAIDPGDPLHWYGSDRKAILGLLEKEPGLSAVLSEKLSIIKAQVVWAVRQEMARTVEDVLSRRTRALQLDAAESIRMAPRVASILARELGREPQWEEEQVRSFTDLAGSYLLSPPTAHHATNP
jgi:glycerol-3-phosphate dehydrogenase